MTCSCTLLLAEGGLMPTISLVVFLIVFASIVTYVFIVPKSAWQKDAEIPLDHSDTPPSEKENRRG
ncbi:MAG: hypothetical protein K8R92_07050 [Planctomycetes bacterium]|nr:hypothetical protein [Planctomycetota bacterium]